MTDKKAPIALPKGAAPKKPAVDAAAQKKAAEAKAAAEAAKAAAEAAAAAAAAEAEAEAAAAAAAGGEEEQPAEEQPAAAAAAGEEQDAADGSDAGAAEAPADGSDAAAADDTGAAAATGEEVVPSSNDDVPDPGNKRKPAEEAEGAPAAKRAKTDPSGAKAAAAAASMDETEDIAAAWSKPTAPAPAPKKPAPAAAAAAAAAAAPKGPAAAAPKAAATKAATAVAPQPKAAAPKTAAAPKAPVAKPAQTTVAVAGKAAAAAAAEETKEERKIVTAAAAAMIASAITGDPTKPVMTQDQLEVFFASENMISQAYDIVANYFRNVDPKDGIAFNRGKSKSEFRKDAPTIMLKNKTSPGFGCRVRAPPMLVSSSANWPLGSYEIPECKKWFKNQDSPLEAHILCQFSTAAFLGSPTTEQHLNPEAVYFFMWLRRVDHRFVKMVCVDNRFAEYIKVQLKKSRWSKDKCDRYVWSKHKPVIISNKNEITEDGADDHEVKKGGSGEEVGDDDDDSPVEGPTNEEIAQYVRYFWCSAPLFNYDYDDEYNHNEPAADIAFCSWFQFCWRNKFIFNRWPMYGGKDGTKRIPTADRSILPGDVLSAELDLRVVTHENHGFRVKPIIVQARKCQEAKHVVTEDSAPTPVLLEFASETVTVNTEQRKKLIESFDNKFTESNAADHILALNKKPAKGDGGLLVAPQQYQQQQLPGLPAPVKRAGAGAGAGSGLRGLPAPTQQQQQRAGAGGPKRPGAPPQQQLQQQQYQQADAPTAGEEMDIGEE